MKTLKLSRNSSSRNLLRAAGDSGIGRELRRRTRRMRGAPESHGAFGGRILGPAALIAAVVSIGYAVQRYTGKSIMGLFGDLRRHRREGGFEPERSYGNVHGTEGARMPGQPDSKRATKRTEPKTIEPG